MVRFICDYNEAISNIRITSRYVYASAGEGCLECKDCRLFESDTGELDEELVLRFAQHPKVDNTYTWDVKMGIEKISV